MTHGLPPRPASTTFRPRFTLMLLYVVGIFFLYCIALVLPDLLQAAQPLPPGVENEKMAMEIGKEVAREVVRPKLLWALAAAVLTVAAGAYTRRLPGLGS